MGCVRCTISLPAPLTDTTVPLRTCRGIPFLPHHWHLDYSGVIHGAARHNASALQFGAEKTAFCCSLSDGDPLCPNENTLGQKGSPRDGEPDLPYATSHTLRWSSARTAHASNLLSHSSLPGMPQEHTSLPASSSPTTLPTKGTKGSTYPSRVGGLRRTLCQFVL